MAYGNDACGVPVPQAGRVVTVAVKIVDPSRGVSVDLPLTMSERLAESVSLTLKATPNYSPLQVLTDMAEIACQMMQQKVDDAVDQWVRQQIAAASTANIGRDC